MEWMKERKEMILIVVMEERDDIKFEEGRGKWLSKKLERNSHE